jgi:hypothetical protein
MKNIDYDVFYRESLPLSNCFLNSDQYDLFISAYNKSARVITVFEKINSKQKYWVIHPEYQFNDDTKSSIRGNKIELRNCGNELQQVNQTLDELNIHDLNTVKICVDCTGFTRSFLIYLIVRLGSLKIKTIDVIFSEPVSYKDKDDTSFSVKTGDVREIFGCAKEAELQHPESLLISIGYDQQQIAHVVNHKESTTPVPMYAFPSLQADMFQQSAYRVSGIDFMHSESDKSADWLSNRLFAPANDPFSTAKKISEYVRDMTQRNPVPNIYLSTLSTKAQAVGFAYYWWLEGRHQENVISIVAPECIAYNSDTTIGLSKVWRFTLEMTP